MDEINLQKLQATDQELGKAISSSLEYVFRTKGETVEAFTTLLRAIFPDKKDRDIVLENMKEMIVKDKELPEHQTILLKVLSNFDE